MQNYFAKNIKSGLALFDAIERACEGLIYISETDSPMLPFAGEWASSINARIILQQAGREANAPVEEGSLEMFFGRLTAIKDWFRGPEQERAARFAELQKLLEGNLNGLRVFRIGKVQVEIIAVGLDREGIVMGVKTNVVET